MKAIETLRTSRRKKAEKGISGSLWFSNMMSLSLSMRQAVSGNPDERHFRSLVGRIGGPTENPS